MLSHRPNYVISQNKTFLINFNRTKQLFDKSYSGSIDDPLLEEVE